jgi:TatD DNase family protein
VIDAHCHLDSDRLHASAAQCWREARAAGVEAIVMAGVDPAGWAAQRELARRLAGVHTVFGIHPQLIPELDRPGLDAMLGHLDEALRGPDRPVALGETGLDRLVAPADSLENQVIAFREQLRLARRHDLPVVLHLLRADALALRVLREEGLPVRGGFVHSFSGSAEFAKALLRLGLHLSFAGTLARPQSRRLREAALACPPERLLIETDTPDQSPPPHRGESNRPAWLPLVCGALADVRGTSLEVMAALTAANTRALLGLPEGMARHADHSGMPS